MSCTSQGLLNLGGNSVYTKRIAEHFTDGPFSWVWSSAAAKMAVQAAFGPVRHLKMKADELVCASQMLQDYGPIQCLTVTGLCSAGNQHVSRLKCAVTCACATGLVLTYTRPCTIRDAPPVLLSTHHIILDHKAA